MKGIKRLLVAVFGPAAVAAAWAVNTHAIVHGVTRSPDASDWVFGVVLGGLSLGAGCLVAVFASLGVKALAAHLRAWVQEGFNEDHQERIRRGEVERIGGGLSMPEPAIGAVSLVKEFVRNDRSEEKV